VALYFSINRGSSRSKAVQRCLAKRGVQLHHLTQQLSVLPSEPDERVALVLGMVHGQYASVIFVRGARQRRDAVFEARADVEDWKAEHGVRARFNITVIHDALVGWSGPPSARNQQLVASCLRR
jgi:hypothetical protein